MLRMCSQGGEMLLICFLLQIQILPLDWTLTLLGGAVSELSGDQLSA